VCSSDLEPEEPLLRTLTRAGDNNSVMPVQHTVYFDAESGTGMLAGYMPLLREAGRILQADPQTRLILQGYAAPAGTKGGQITRSAARVWFCTELLKKEYGIAEDRIRMAFFGAEGMTEEENAEWNLRRRVEIIVEEPVQFHYEVFFEADSGTRMSDRYLPMLQTAGRRISAYPHARLVLRGYVPSGADEAQITVSAARVWYCTEYLKKEYGIAEERIRIAFSGAGGPGGTGSNVRRRVEVFSEMIGDPEPEEPLLRPSAEMRVGGEAGNWSTPMRRTIRFEAESGIRMIDLPLLQEAGRLLRSDSRTRIALRGYAAPTGTRGGQITRSAARIRSCVEYLMREDGIPERRIRTAFFGAEGMSEAENADWNLRRGVEIIVEEPKPETRQYTVYFVAGSSQRILARSLPVLRAAGARLRAYPKTYITLRGYAAPTGTPEGQRAISAARVWFCAGYLMREYGIPESRIRMAFLGAEETPGAGSTDLNRYRRVEITVEQD
jgi:outer membrane protein OmpA-like peptidoglycan-associated protein